MNGEDNPFRDGEPGGNGRGPDGRFVVGWRGGSGAPPGRVRQRLDTALKAEDIDRAVEIMRQCMEDVSARWSDRIAAAREILDRGCGRTSSPDVDSAIEFIFSRAREKGIL